jgi:hypothetical protein
VTVVNQSDGTPTLGTTALAYDARGNRTSDDNTSTLTNDRRDYTYDGRGNLINVHGKYYTGSAWHEYDVGSAFDHKNRRVYKFFLDNKRSKRVVVLLRCVRSARRGLVRLGCGQRHDVHDLPFVVA